MLPADDELTLDKWAALDSTLVAAIRLCGDFPKLMGGKI